MIQEIQRKDRVSYKVKVYVEGRQVTKTFRRKRDAQLWEQQIVVDRERKVLNPKLTTNFQTLREFSQEWFVTKVSGKSPKTQDSYRTQLEHHILPLIGDVRLTDLSMSHGLKVVLSLRAKGKAPKGINMAIGVLKSVLNDANRWEVIEKNPFKNLGFEKLQPKSQLYWMPDEINAFLSKNRTQDEYSVWVVALNTGMRRGELFGLMWDMVDFRNRLILVSRTRDRHGLRNQTKTCSSYRYIPMNDVVYEELKKLKAAKLHSEFVFVKRDGTLFDVQHVSEREFARAVRRAEVKKIRFHDLRHTYASNMSMAPGGDLFALSKILGHSSVEMTAKKYAHLHNTFLKKVANSVGFSGEVSVVA